jgi:hypothetical protein
MPTLEGASGRDFLPNIAAAFDKTVLGFEKQAKKEKAAQKEEDILFERDIIAAPEGEFSAEDVRAARIRLGQLDPQASAAVENAIKSGNAEAIAEANQMAVQGAKNASFVQQQKSFDEKKEAWREVIRQKIADGRASQAEIDEDTAALELSEDEFNLKMDRMVVLGTDIATLTGETFDEVPGRPDLQRGSRTGKLSAIPGAVTPEKRFAARVAQEKEALAAGQKTITATEGNQTKVLQFNPETNRFDIPVSKTFTKPDTIEFESDGFKVTQQFDPNTGVFKEIGRSPVDTPEAATDLGKIQQDVKNGFLTPEQGTAQEKILAATKNEFKSKVGKLLGDQTAAIQLFGEDSPQVKAINAAIQSEQKGEKPKLTDIAGLRKEFTKESGDFVKVRDAINKVRNTNPDAAGDLAMIFNFMKILDPGSTVREGEFANAQNSGSIPERVWALYNQMKTGERLTPPQRKRFLAQAERTFSSTLETQKQLEENFRGIAKRNGVDPRDVIVNFRPKEAAPPTEVPVPPGQAEGTKFTGSFTPEGKAIFERPNGTQFSAKVKR